MNLVPKLRIVVVLAHAHDVKFHVSNKMAADIAECEDFLTLANPALVRCFEEAEKTFQWSLAFRMQCSQC